MSENGIFKLNTKLFGFKNRTFLYIWEGFATNSLTIRLNLHTKRVKES
jgi:hypothetical protein